MPISDYTGASLLPAFGARSPARRRRSRSGFSFVCVVSVWDHVSQLYEWSVVEGGGLVFGDLVGVGISRRKC